MIGEWNGDGGACDVPGVVIWAGSQGVLFAMLRSLGFILRIIRCLRRVLSWKHKAIMIQFSLVAGRRIGLEMTRLEAGRLVGRLMGKLMNWPR